MSRSARRVQAVCMLLSVAAVACDDGGRGRPPSETAPPGVVTTAPGGELPEGYLDDASDLIRERAFYADRVDWPAVQVEARRLSSGAGVLELSGRHRRRSRRRPLRRGGPRRHPAGRHPATPRMGCRPAAQHRLVIASDAGGRRADPGRGRRGRLPREDGTTTWWGYEDGRSWSPASRTCHWPPASRLTGSAGEGVAMAFRGRPGHAQLRRADGRRPHGNAQHRLPDGAELYLTEGIGVDRTGRTHERRLRPDQPVATNWTRYATSADPVLKAATAWLAGRCGRRS